MADPAALNSLSAVLTNLGKLLPDLQPLYKDIHAHPELSMREMGTAGIAAESLRKAGYEVTTGVGKAGVVGLLRKQGFGGGCRRQHSSSGPYVWP